MRKPIKNKYFNNGIQRTDFCCFSPKKNIN